MSIVKINPTPSLPPTKSSTSGYSNSSDNKSGNKGGSEDNYSGLTFQDILNQKLDIYGARHVS